MRFGRHFLSRNISELDGKPVGKHRKSCSSTEFSRSQRVAEDSPRMMAAAGCLVRGSGGACKTGGMTLLSRDLAPSVLVRLGFAIYLIIKPAFLICSKVSKVIFSPSWSRERERERHQDFPRLSLLGGKPPRPTTPSSPFFSCRASWQRHTPLRNAMGILGSFCKV